MKFFLLAIILTIPPLEDFYLAIEQFWDRELKARILIFERTEQKPWTKFLPNIGAGYTVGTKKVEGETILVGKFRPTLSFNLNKIHDYFQEKELRKLSIESIIQEVNLLKETNKLQVKELYHNYLDRTELFELSKEQSKIDSILFSFIERDYENPEIDISPSDYFSKKKIYLSVVKSIKTEEFNLKATEREIVTISHLSN